MINSLIKWSLIREQRVIDFDHLDNKSIMPFKLVTFMTERTAKVVTKKDNKVTAAGSPPPQYYANNPLQQQQQYPAVGERKTTVGGGPKARERQDPSLNPFGGPMAVNIFESPFPRGKQQPEMMNNNKTCWEIEDQN